MRFAGIAFGLATLVATQAAAAAVENFPTQGATVVSGKCSKLVVGKLDASKGCKPELASVTAPDGSVTFIFTSGGKMLGFRGNGKGIKPGSQKGTAQLPIDAIATGAGNNISNQVAAKGSCTFANPYAGKPIAIQCTAKSPEMSFNGSFTSDGKAPRHK
ncbi:MULTISPECIES: hypothetical protein [unclassified Rhizobium]|jgi:hypothetical protein|uniref:hypothetical protein n=1 Tax=unclassified Rhizobium TaxID=2613769 RepID=UPI000646EF9C|nr:MULTISPECIES: hypothetical protein [unclassified Rhizobium]MBN8949538.1 hypothetical protein [Rhizobium tropici]OJY75322.1 MAG: hypothetical protein BGP09_36665 [Rhizobium sp. 60-20]RKD70676.1 hypothetical protein BJ928_103194 [Rhizobium sp. WW_1]